MTPFTTRFVDRRQAGRVLAQKLGRYRERDVVVLGLSLIHI